MFFTCHRDQFLSLNTASGLASVHTGLKYKKQSWAPAFFGVFALAQFTPLAKPFRALFWP
jgi:hypothetical protein